jgi:hypothetical protein
VDDPPAGEAGEEPHEPARRLRGHLGIDLHLAAEPRAAAHPPARPAERDPPVGRRARVVQQGALVGDRLAARPPERLDDVGHRAR